MGKPASSHCRIAANSTPMVTIAFCIYIFLQNRFLLVPWLSVLLLWYQNTDTGMILEIWKEVDIVILKCLNNWMDCHVIVNWFWFEFWLYYMNFLIFLFTSESMCSSSVYSVSRGYCADTESVGRGRLSPEKKEGGKTKRKGRAAAAESISGCIIPWKGTGSLCSSWRGEIILA